MPKKSIVEIRQDYSRTAPFEMANFIAQYSADTRKGVVALVARARRAAEIYSEQSAHLASLYQFDLSHCKTGRVVGIDEAGRGPLAGPVVAAACVIEPCRELLGIDDSKKLSEAERERLYQVIVERAISYGVGIVNNVEIDQINILNATKKAMQQALNNCAKAYQVILTDYVKLSGLAVPLHSIVKGDAKSLAIAAASVIAKVTRDRMMQHYDQKYPQYGFAKHKGYGTAEHIANLQRQGACPIHRQTFIKKLVTVQSKSITPCHLDQKCIARSGDSRKV